MRSQPKRPTPSWAALAGMTILAFLGRGAYSQDLGGDDDSQVPRIAQTPQATVRPMAPGPYGFPSTPDFGTTAGAPTTGGTEFGPPAAPAGPGSAASAFEAALGPEQFAVRGGPGVAIADNVGYIDSAIIRSRIRQRYDSAYDNNRPDRAEFFYPKCGCFGNPDQRTTLGPLFDRRALGPQHGMGPRYPGEPRVDYQEIATYLEYAANSRTSGFIEMPARFVNYTFHKDTYGWSDMNLGFKHAFVANPNQFYTFQFRTYVPTGSGEKGLGTNHASLEPALLVFQRLSERLYFSGELRDWIPVHATNFGGNVLRYGAGLAYNTVLTEHVRVAPVAEFVGWSVLSGQKLSPTPATAVAPFEIQSAAHDTIVNGKFGLRFGLGNYSQPGGGSNLNDRHSLYIGYGRALTGDHWYKDILRVEYNFWF